MRVATTRQWRWGGLHPKERGRDKWGGGSGSVVKMEGQKGSSSIGTGARRGDGGPTLEQQARVSVGDATSAGEGHMCGGGGRGLVGPGLAVMREGKEREEMEMTCGSPNRKFNNSEIFKF
jgi:hypothetical protein